MLNYSFDIFLSIGIFKKFEKLFIESRNADTRAREATVKALQEAERLRMESEKTTAELAMKLAGGVKNTLTDNVIVQAPAV